MTKTSFLTLLYRLLIAILVISGIALLIGLAACKRWDIVTTTSDGWHMHSKIQNDSTLYLK